MHLSRLVGLGGVLAVLLAAVFIQLSSAEANPEPGKVIFKSPSASYEYEVGSEKGQATTFLTTTATTTTTTTTEASFKPKLIYPGFTAKNMTEPPTLFSNDKNLMDNYEHAPEESRRISIAIRPMGSLTSASENTAVEVKVRKSISSSREIDPRSNEVIEADVEDDLEQRKRDCRGLPWPFVNALNATNCMDLDEEQFSPRLIKQNVRSDEDEDDATIVLPKKKKNKPMRIGNRRMQQREEDYEEDTPYDPFHSPLPQARSYHEWAMMLRDSAPSDDGYGPYNRGPVSYQDFHNNYRNPYEDHGWGWSTTPAPTGWGWSTTQAPNQRQPHELKPSFGQPSQPGQQSASFGTPSQTSAQGKQLTFGQPSSQPVQTPPASFGQPSPLTNQSAPVQSTSRTGKALEFGTPSQQAVVSNAQQASTQPPPQNSQFQQRVGQPANPSYLAPAYYPPTTPSPKSDSGWGWETTTQGWQSTTQGWPSTTTEGWGWNENGWTSTTPAPEYKQPQYGQQNQPPPTVYPIVQNANKTASSPAPPQQIQTQPQQQPQQQQQPILPNTDISAMNQTQVMDLYNRLLDLYKVIINDTSGSGQQQGPPSYEQSNPWQVPPPQVWSGAVGRGRDYDGYYPDEMMTGIQNSDPYMYDPLDQPKLLPRPISPVGRRRSRQFRQRNAKLSDERESEPRVSYMNNGPTVLHEVSNNKEFLPSRRYYKRKIDDKDFKKIDGKKNIRRWGSSSDDDLDYDDVYAGSRQYKHPNVPPWLKYGYQAPVYGPPPPPENGGGWGQGWQPTSSGWTTTQKPGWGWEEPTTQKPGWGWEEPTTQKPGWGWEEPTTQKPGWGWEETTTTTQAPPQEQQQQQPPPSEQQQPPPNGQQQQQPPSNEQQQQPPPNEQQTSVNTTEEGPAPGQQWTPPSDQYQNYVNQLQQLQQQLLQLQGNRPQAQQQQQANPNNNFGSASYPAQPIQQPPPSATSIQPGTNQQQSVIEDIGRRDPTGPIPAFRDQPSAQGTRYGTSRQLFDGSAQGPVFPQTQSVVSTVTSTSVSESLGPTVAPVQKLGENPSTPLTAAVQVVTGQPQQVSGTNTPTPPTNSTTPAQVTNDSSIPKSTAAQQLLYSPSSTEEANQAPSWGNWGGFHPSQQKQPYNINVSPTYSRVQEAQPYTQSQPYNIMKRGGSTSLIETLSEAKKKIGGEPERPSLVARVMD